MSDTKAPASTAPKEPKEPKRQGTTDEEEGLETDKLSTTGVSPPHLSLHPFPNIASHRTV